MVMGKTLEQIQRREAEIQAARRAAEQHQQRPQEVVVKVNAVPQTQASNTQDIGTQHTVPGKFSIKSTGGHEQREQVDYRPMPSSLKHHEKSLWHRVADYVKTDDLSKVFTILYGVTATGIIGVMSFTVLWGYLKEGSKEVERGRLKNVLKDNKETPTPALHNDEDFDNGMPEMPTLDRRFTAGFSVFEPGSFAASRTSSFRPVDLNTEATEEQIYPTSSSAALAYRYTEDMCRRIQEEKEGMLYKIVNYMGLSPRGAPTSSSWRSERTESTAALKTPAMRVHTEEKEARSINRINFSIFDDDDNSQTEQLLDQNRRGSDQDSIFGSSYTESEIGAKIAEGKAIMKENMYITDSAYNLPPNCKSLDTTNRLEDDERDGDGFDGGTGGGTAQGITVDW
ncbi:hypothetical protein EDM53_04210 [Rickettsiales endosymbiont of Peranema trichophorum]|uniref:hypothetical protein n=1 Tax=Rickettsiales endosymbiont of Peranema trichophorum TaxID=2486577 RepID=UPI001023DA1C|nr:hypothetical protein [Rickettsiales endosymbiont of Peranema trichophorum]RZI46333.1 hypothetical protein EDM53_04210 [Rickettsiales endosymbiont of Peranema trichophorum]